MILNIRAERLKMKHTFGSILPQTAALLTLVLTLGLAYGNEYYSANAWNWWYVMLLPGMLCVMCCLGIKREKKMHYCNLLSLPVSTERCLMAKIVCYAMGLCTANLIIAAGTFAAGRLWGSDIPLMNGFAAAILLCICYLWVIPLFLWLGARFGTFISLFSCMVLSAVGVGLLADSDLWWLFPAAIPVRLMCPVLGIMPNGLLVSPDSPLRDAGIILPGILICLIWFVFMTYVSIRRLIPAFYGAYGTGIT